MSNKLTTIGDVLKELSKLSLLFTDGTKLSNDATLNMMSTKLGLGERAANFLESSVLAGANGQRVAAVFAIAGGCAMVGGGAYGAGQEALGQREASGVEAAAPGQTPDDGLGVDASEENPAEKEGIEEVAGEDQPSDDGLGVDASEENPAEEVHVENQRINKNTTEDVQRKKEEILKHRRAKARKGELYGQGISGVAQGLGQLFQTSYETSKAFYEKSQKIQEAESQAGQTAEQSSEKTSQGQSHMVDSMTGMTDNVMQAIIISARMA